MELKAVFDEQLKMLFVQHPMVGTIIVIDMSQTTAHRAVQDAKKLEFSPSRSIAVSVGDEQTFKESREILLEALLNHALKEGE